MIGNTCFYEKRLPFAVVKFRDCQSIHLRNNETAKNSTNFFII